ncbi:TetR/AcrR family transcriptional regulator [Actinomadura bangladeshensis]|uniref:TetR/AcrR family transcriptional regulator n=1 Tax=Actinomadura bangladeshensis TaxID=453573 RepID=A0A6L9QCP9_9ACTN|nr:TetR/AcrR family transcriptional regulator [Actinomadura bangladeshensis]NEA23045.1 TetR/AcrR family transcriptional regulator [Actinomadura bangladeshensis]
MARSIEEPRNARSRRSRLALLRAARELVEEHGMAATTMAAVAERAGVSRRAVYLHFASRADLISELFGYVNAVEDLEGRFAPIEEAPDAVTALEVFARRHAAVMPRVLAVSRAVEREAGSDPDAARHWAAALRRRQEANRALVRRLDEEGVLAPGWTVDTAADMLLALVSNGVSATLLDEREWTPEQIGEHLALLLRSTFTAGG